MTYVVPLGIKLKTFCVCVRQVCKTCMITPTLWNHIMEGNDQTTTSYKLSVSMTLLICSFCFISVPTVCVPGNRDSK